MRPKSPSDDRRDPELAPSRSAADASPRPSVSSRRSFLKGGAAATAAGLVAAACDRAPDPYQLVKPRVPGPATYKGEEHRVLTSCAQCPVGCGLSVRVVEGRAVHIEGNVDHPVNLGCVGPRGQSGLDVLYAPNRLKGPLRRAGGKRTAGWEPISWDQALSEVGGRLREIRAKAPEGLAIVSGRERGMVRDLWSRFAGAFRTPNFLEYSRRVLRGALGLAAAHALGTSDAPTYDIAHSGTVLSLGAALAEASCMGTYAARTRALGRHSQARRRTRFFHVEANYSLSASLADEWIAIKPGTLDVFAMGVAQVLISQNLYDQAFVADHTFGFHPWTDLAGQRHQGFAELADTFKPDRAAALTGVRADTFERVANALVEAPPPLVISTIARQRAPMASRSFEAPSPSTPFWGASVEREGSCSSSPRPFRIGHPCRRWPSLSRAARCGGPLPLSANSELPRGSRQGHRRGEAVSDRSAVLLLRQPASRPGGDTWLLATALAKVPLVVSFSPFEDETTAVADYVLPDHTYLGAARGLRRRAFDRHSRPGLETAGGDPTPRHASHRRRDLRACQGDRRRRGGRCPWASFESALLQRISGLRKLGRGNFTAPDDAAFLKTLRKKGFWMDTPSEGEPLVYGTPWASSSSFPNPWRRRTGRSRIAPLRSPPLAPLIDALALGAPLRLSGWAMWPSTALPAAVSLHQRCCPGGLPLPHLSELGDPLTGARWSVPPVEPQDCPGVGVEGERPGRPHLSNAEPRGSRPPLRGRAPRRRSNGALALRTGVGSIDRWRTGDDAQRPQVAGGCTDPDRRDPLASVGVRVERIA